MSGVVRQLKDAEGTKVYPVAKASACYMNNGKDTVQRILNDQIDQDTDIAFSGNSITTELASGTVVTTVFNDDGSITETTKNSDDVIVQIKDTVFNEDGTISISIRNEEED